MWSMAAVAVMVGARTRRISAMDGRMSGPADALDTAAVVHLADHTT
jgi:hypothetical protein